MDELPLTVLTPIGTGRICRTRRADCTSTRMQLRWKRAAAATVFVSALGAMPSNGASEVDVNVQPRSCIAPCNILVTVSVTPASRNRFLRLEVDSEEYFRSSEEGLDGDKAARRYAFAFPALPAGAYRVVAAVFRNDGTSAQADVKIELVGS
jgi:hypothetical protein